jgi:hypothetical protein
MEKSARKLMHWPPSIDRMRSTTRQPKVPSRDGKPFEQCSQPGEVAGPSVNCSPLSFNRTRFTLSTKSLRRSLYESNDFRKNARALHAGVRNT